MQEHELALPTDWGRLCGTLTVPDGEGPWPVALLIAGSGPTDRDGNSPLLETPCDNLKLLAHALATHGIASLRYDKRGVGASVYPGLGEAELRFDQLVDDAVAWAAMLQADARFGELVLVGHSEGALVAALAAGRMPVRALVSLAGAGERASTLMRRQVAGKLPAELAAAADNALAALEEQSPVSQVPDALGLLLRPSVQPYLMSWFRHHPTEVLARVQVPVLLVHGASDTQVDVAHAGLLQAARPDAASRILQDVDHLLALQGDVAAGVGVVAQEVAVWLHGLQAVARPS